jgi:hypothetical protein
MESPNTTPAQAGEQQSATSTPTAPRPRVTDRVTSGKRRFLRGDGRSREARRWIALHDAYRDALPQRPTVSQGALLRTLATASLALEVIAAQQAHGEPVDDERLVALANLQSRLMDRLGIGGSSEPPKPDPVAEHRKRMGWDK